MSDRCFISLQLFIMSRLDSFGYVFTDSLIGFDTSDEKWERDEAADSCGNSNWRMEHSIYFLVLH